MDNPDSPENKIQEATWQEDENRATLFLRSAFVLLSGALILGTEFYTSFSSLWIEVLYLLFMNIGFPISIIWFFFGQGLHPVEWLSDQKYNAWNYGINFKDWKTHLKWASVLFVLGILPCTWVTSDLINPNNRFFSLNLILILQYLSQHLFLLLCVGWLIATSFTWLIWGYLLFGCIQGFPKILVFIIFAIILYAQTVLGVAYFTFILIIPFLLFSFLSFISCWKTKSIAPMLYAIIFWVPVSVYLAR